MWGWGPGALMVGWGYTCLASVAVLECNYNYTRAVGACPQSETRCASRSGGACNERHCSLHSQKIRLSGVVSLVQCSFESIVMSIFGFENKKLIEFLRLCRIQ